jgi:tetratricopeptide (TPR) repeat protein
MSRIPLLFVFLLLLDLLFSPGLARSQDADRFFSQAREHQEKGEWDLAEKSYLQFLLQVPNSAAGHSNLGIVYVHQRKFAEAVREYRTALSIDPSLSGVYLNLGIAYFQEGEYAAATPVLERFLLHLPGSVQAQELLGLCYMESDKYEDAIKMLAPLEAQGSLDVLLVLSASYIRLGRMPEAQAILEKLLNSPESKSVQVHFLMGQTYLGLNQYAQSLKEFEEVYALDPHWPQIDYLLGGVEAKLGRFQEAEQHLRKELDQNPRRVRGQFGLGRSPEQTGEVR